MSQHLGGTTARLAGSLLYDMLSEAPTPSDLQVVFGVTDGTHLGHAQAKGLQQDMEASSLVRARSHHVNPQESSTQGKREREGNQNTMLWQSTLSWNPCVFNYGQSEDSARLSGFCCFGACAAEKSGCSTLLLWTLVPGKEMTCPGPGPSDLF